MMAHTPPKSTEDYRITSAVNEKFHHVIGKAARSPRLMAVQSLTVDVGVVARTYFNYSEDDLMRSAQHHKEITDAITAKAPKLAVSAMSPHILAAAASASKADRRAGDV